MEDSKQLKGKVVLITGASSGIGRGCASDFAKEGCFLSLTGRNLSALQETKEVCLKCNSEIPEDKVLLTVADMSQDEDTDKVISATTTHFGRIDVLVNNAGILISGDMESCKMEDFDKQININLRSPFLLTKLALPYLLETKGNVVNISSIAGTRAFPHIEGYCISKAGLDQMTRCLALEVASRGVRVNAVNPGVVVTDIHKRGGMDEKAYAAFLEHSKTTHAMARVGEVEEVSRVVVFLASHHASFITGATLPIDGGRGIMCPR